ncbi:response regulator transcription factor [Vagococcus intermedius]|uniref:Response regulator transcription factor n=1 Tax=Vagococcus intermedius TaxID=2991418 RepID=A0AAF0CUU7_9ENTE|nr:response regulator transcription factor [Vagococcus intermedius]WEG73296.1 response regulator transcription factor [Vagococcus intermedius]WEG75377.1 response regulator transcription factor [Vagococcus intermedius]
MHILIVDDEPTILEFIAAYLQSANYTVSYADSGIKALDSWQKLKPDLIVLDWMLPDLSGIEVCQTIREQADTPIIMLTAKTAENDLLTGLKLGADDYLTKPFSPKELVARIEVVLRRTHPISKIASQFNQGKLRLEYNTQQVFLDQTEIILTATEWDILSLLTQHPKQIFTREQLIEQTRGLEFDGFDRAIDSHIKNLRQKLGDSPRHPTYIVTVHGKGYRFGNIT